MVRSADASPCRQRDDTFASASPSSPAGGGAANVVSAPQFSLLLSSPTDSLELALPPRAVERKNSLDSAASPAPASGLSSMTTSSPPPSFSPPTSTPPTIAPAPMAHREDATAAALWTRRMRGAGEQPDAGAPSSAPTSTEW